MWNIEPRMINIFGTRTSIPFKHAHFFFNSSAFRSTPTPVTYHSNMGVQNWCMCSIYARLPYPWGVTFVDLHMMSLYTVVLSVSHKTTTVLLPQEAIMELIKQGKLLWKTYDILGGAEDCASNSIGDPLLLWRIENGRFNTVCKRRWCNFECFHDFLSDVCSFCFHVRIVGGL